MAGPTQVQIAGSWGGDLLVLPDLNFVLLVPPSGAQFSIPIPSDLGLCGLEGYLQILQADPGAAKKLSSSRGLRLEFGL